MILKHANGKYYPLRTALNSWLRTTASTLQPALELNPVLSGY